MKGSFEGLRVFGAFVGQRAYNIASWAQLVLFVHLSTSGVESIVGVTSADFFLGDHFSRFMP